MQDYDWPRIGRYALIAMIIFAVLGAVLGPWWIWWPLGAVCWALATFSFDDPHTAQRVSAPDYDDASGDASRH